MLTGLHLVLTYRCTLECDHCFVYGSPHAEAVFTLEQVRKVLDEAIKIGSIEWIYFEGGEPFLYHPLLVEALKSARDKGFQTGVVTNAYWATTEADAELWLEPLAKLGVADFSVSDDELHYPGETETPAKLALRAAAGLGIPADAIRCVAPGGSSPGNVRCRGRAAERLVQGLPLKAWDSFRECPDEDLVQPERVHLDPLGNVHLCQGLSLGNMWETPLSQLLARYDAESHPICAPLVEGGPSLLAGRYGVDVQAGYVDACHLCYLTRRALVDRFPEYLAPRLVYGLD